MIKHQSGHNFQEFQRNDLLSTVKTVKTAYSSENLLTTDKRYSTQKLSTHSAVLPQLSALGKFEAQ